MAQNTEMMLNRAKKAARAGEWAAAQGLYQDVLDRFPANKRARLGIEALKAKAVPDLLEAAQAAKDADKWIEAETNLTAAAALQPETAEIGVALALWRLETGRVPAGLDAADAVLARYPGHPGALNARGRALRDMGRTTEAEACFQAALGNADTDADTLNNLGILVRAQGDRKAAAAYFRKGLEVCPTDPGLHRNLAHAVTYKPGDPHIDEVRALLAKADPNDPKIANYHLALFKAYHDLGQPAEAFAHLEKGNRLRRTDLGYSFDKDAIRFASTVALFSRPIDPLTETGPLAPVFVTGLPRSGTTLTERILSRAPGVQPCGELDVVSVAVGRIMREVMERNDKSLTRDDLVSLRTEILEGLARYSDGSPVLVDKSPLNFRAIGFICAALPEARIVHLRRDPIAVAWSLYRHAFVGVANAFVYDPDDIARFMALHQSLMTHWRTLYGDRIFDLDYAALVSDPETTTRALAHATGLTWSSDWLAPEGAMNPILTASSEQARKPIYTGSDAEWKRYETQLQPLLAALRGKELI